MENLLPSAVLEICVLVGVSRDKVKEVCQAAQKNDVKNFPPFEPEVLSVFVPPFISKQEFQATTINSNAFNKTKRRSFRKKKEKSKIESARTLNGAQKLPETEDISVPKDVDLNGLPQLCFPGGFFVTSELKDDHIHFLVFTDVFGNRTYGVVAQYCQPVQDGHISSNGQVHWETVQTSKAAAYFLPYAICVISRYPYFNALKDCLSCLLVQLKPYKDLDVDDYIKEFAAKLSLIPSPPPGPLHLVTIQPAVFSRHCSCPCARFLCNKFCFGTPTSEPNSLCVSIKTGRCASLSVVAVEKSKSPGSTLTTNKTSHCPCLVACF